MAVIKFMLGNMRRNKSYNIVICILVFMTGLILSVTTSTMTNAVNAFQKAYSRMGGPQLIYMVDESNYSDDFKQWFEQRDDVEAVRLVTVYNSRGALLQRERGTISNFTNSNFLVYDPQDRMSLTDSKYSAETTLSQGEIYLPYIYKVSDHVSVGETITFTIDGRKLQFKVAGFAEELTAGGKLDSDKNFFISQADADKLMEPGSASIYRYMQMRVRLTTDDEAVSNQISKEFMSNYGYRIGYVKTLGSIKNNILILPNLAIATMLCFAILLCAITVTILRYAILSTIEKDYTNIGIVKALGFTPNMVQVSITGQYALLAMISGIVSLIAGVFITPVLGQFLMSYSGIIFKGRLSASQSLITLLSLVAMISLFSYITARRSKKISPIRAITNGIAPVYFSSRINVRLDKLKWLPFNVSMALKQILTKSKRYLLLITISAILAYVLCFSFGLVEAFRGEQALGMMGAEFSDIKVVTNSKAETEELISQISQDYGINWYYFKNKIQLQIEQEWVSTDIRDDFNTTGIIKPLSGKFPVHDNEIAITALLESRYNKHIGDYVQIKDPKGELHDFIISGIFQTADDGGVIIMMNSSGIKSLIPDFVQQEAFVKLTSYDDLDSTVKELQTRYTGYKEISNSRKSMAEQINTIKVIFVAISQLFFILTIVLITIITLLMMKITIYGETKELGIYKAVGFSSARLRLQLALRFALITIFGGSIGIIIETLYGAKLFSYLLEFAGISSFYVNFSLINAVLPVVIIALLAMISSYISSSKTKHISAYKLISE